MPKTNEFCDYVVDLLSPLGQASYKFMFGGYGIYVGGLMIAIMADDRLLLRADDENRPDYEALGIGPFQPYENKNHSMPFYAVPDEVMDNPDELVDWARKSLAATLRMKAKSGKKTGGAKRKSVAPRWQQAGRHSEVAPRRGRDQAWTARVALVGSASWTGIRMP